MTRRKGRNREGKKNGKVVVVVVALCNVLFFCRLRCTTVSGKTEKKRGGGGYNTQGYRECRRTLSVVVAGAQQQQQRSSRPGHDKTISPHHCRCFNFSPRPLYEPGIHNEKKNPFSFVSSYHLQQYYYETLFRISSFFF